MIKPYRDEHGRLRAGVEATAAALGDFLETEVGENPVVVHDLLRGLAQVRGGQAARWEFHGTLYRLRLGTKTVRITNVQDDHAPSADLPLETFEAVLGTWRRSWIPPR